MPKSVVVAVMPSVFYLFQFSRFNFRFRFRTAFKSEVILMFMFIMKNQNITNLNTTLKNLDYLFYSILFSAVLASLLGLFVGLYFRQADKIEQLELILKNLKQ